MPPVRLLVERVIGNFAQLAHHHSIALYGARREFGAGRLIHKRHELVRETRHGAADTDAADVRAATEPGHPAALGHVALHYRPPAAQLDQALGRTILMR